MTVAGSPSAAARPATAGSAAGYRVPERLVGLAVAAAAAAVLITGRGLTPASAGLATHTQLGLPACGMLERTGLPCGTCGMTTATALAARGRFLDSVLTQPAGFLFAFAVASLFWVGLWACWRGLSLAPLGRVLLRGRVVAAIAAVVVAAWAYKAIQVGLLAAT